MYSTEICKVYSTEIYKVYSTEINKVYSTEIYKVYNTAQLPVSGDIRPHRGPLWSVAPLQPSR